MGLLDDAIREHLELKRRGGADTDALARAERDAFGSADETESARPGEPQRTAGAIEIAPDAPPPATTARDEREQTPSAGERQPDDRAQGTAEHGGETAELDMQTVLGETQLTSAVADVARAGTGARPIAARTRRSSDEPPPDEPLSDSPTGEDSLEWEVPGERRRDGHAERAGSQGPQERIGTGATDEAVDDVLEATPDFLSETPDQERLWFEQRPPRDFDFDR